MECDCLGADYYTAGYFILTAITYTRHGRVIEFRCARCGRLHAGRVDVTGFGHLFP